MSRFSYINRKPLPPVPKAHFKSLASGEEEEEEEEEGRTVKPWRPVTLRPLYLCALATITIGLIILIQWLLYLSRRDQGILFAKDINDLPISRSFSYMYLPTIISVIYSFLWTWADLDIKRLEPYFQLSRDRGTSGEDSISLSYPLEFLLTLPITAFKHKHWSVLSASMVMIMVLWGLTPTQAGIFATRTISINEDVAGTYSTEYTVLAQQGNLSALYAQSVYNIAWLNETLPEFMTKEYVLARFGPIDGTSNRAINTTYTASTEMYSVDLSCEGATLWNQSGTYYYNSSEGCSFAAPRYRPMGGNDTSKPYDALYVGYQNQNGFASYYLSADCDETFFHTFLVRWSKSTDRAIEDANEPGNMNPNMGNETSLFCHATYYQQFVNATISLPTNEVLDVRPLGNKLPLPADLFNVSTFEWAMSSGVEEFQTRGDYPTSSFPDQKSQLLDTPLNLVFIPRMAPFAIATSQHPIEDYMDAETLRTAYQSAYRLLFARQLSDVLKPDSRGQQLQGQRTYITQTVLVVPAFAYAATVLLSLVLILLSGLIVAIPRRANKLQQDPCTIRTIMTLVSGHDETVNVFTPLDGFSAQALQRRLQKKRFCLRHDPVVDSCRFRVQHHPKLDYEVPEEGNVDASDFNSKGVRPMEMKLVAGALFFILQIASFITFAVLYYKSSSNNGLPLPSQSTFVRQLVQHYIPIALATIMEPFWLVLNRLLSILQPFEELRKGNVVASRTIDLDYVSLPPQLLFVRAFRARHFVLAFICFMVLLANVLAVALSGLMYEGSANIATTVSISQSILPRFRSLDGTGTPFNGKQNDNSQGGTTAEPFYLEMSNLTANTPLPPWIDEQYAYLPVELGDINHAATVQLQTTAFGAALSCQKLLTEGPNHYALRFNEDASEVSLNVTLQRNDSSVVECSNFKPWTRSYADSALNELRDSQPGHVALELNAMLSSRKTLPENDLYCRQHILAGWVRADWAVVTGKDAGNTFTGLPRMRLESMNETMLLCEPTLSIGTADIVVDSLGRVKRRISANMSTTSLERYFTSSSMDLVAQANQFLIDSDSTWHSDSAPSDYDNYLIRTIFNDTALLDSNAPAPNPNVAALSLALVYQRLFALLIGINTNLLFEDASEPSTLLGRVVTPHTRVLLSTPAFIVAEVILATYIITTVFFYIRRPWRILPRLPDSLASIIAFFAASNALKDLSSGSGSGQVVDAPARWGYGTFTGSDGQQHVGIEREPFVSRLQGAVVTSTMSKDGLLKPMLLKTSAGRTQV